MGFERFQQLLAPTYLQGPNGQLFIGFTGRAKDREMALLKAGILLRLPTETSPDDTLALYYQGRDRDLARHPGDSGETYRQRLIKAFDLWELGGTIEGTQTALVPFGMALEDVIVLDAGTPEPLIWDDADWYSRSLIILLNPPWSFAGAGAWGDNDGTWGTADGYWVDGSEWGTDDGSWGEGDVTWGSSATEEEITAVRREIWKWKGDGDFPLEVVLVFAGSVWGDGGTWGTDDGDWDDDGHQITRWKTAYTWGWEAHSYEDGPEGSEGAWGSDDGVWSAKPPDVEGP